MNQTFAALVLAAAGFGALPATASPSTCTDDDQARGLRARVENMHRQMDKAQVLSDPAEQRRLLELHAKHMREGMRELRRRDSELQPGCRMELMHEMMEQVIAHQVAVQDLDQR